MKRRFLTYLALLVPTVVLSGFMRAFVLEMLWGWFLVPTFATTTPSFARCFGIMMICSLGTRGFMLKYKEVAITRERTDPSGSIEERWGSHTLLRENPCVKADLNELSYSVGETMKLAIIAPLAVLTIGWIAHFFV